MNFKRLDYREPAVLRGIVTAALALAASLGFSASTEINGAAEVWLPLLSTLVPIAQAAWTRRAVFSPETVEKIGRHAAPEH